MHGDGTEQASGQGRGRGREGKGGGGVGVGRSGGVGGLQDGGRLTKVWTVSRPQGHVLDFVGYLLPAGYSLDMATDAPQRSVLLMNSKREQ